ncbi:MAG TPA: glycosyltransferase [Phycisphaerae bacterium]|nr:glycosyltransferase [Phycisphaerae bacterium]
MIPKLIHQTAKTADIPLQWRQFQTRIKELHPGWTYKLWTDEDNLGFVSREYPEFLKVFTGLPKNIMRADVIRYLLMYRLGGLYMDLDYEMLKPFDLEEQEIVLPWEGGHAPGQELICNSIFASSAGHPFWKMAIDDLAANPPKGDGPVEAQTGPGFLTRVMKRAEGQGMTFYRPEWQLFSPRIPASARAHRRLVEGKVAYGIHHCHGTWREWGLKDRIKMRLLGMYYWIKE